MVNIFQAHIFQHHHFYRNCDLYVVKLLSILAYTFNTPSSAKRTHILIYLWRKIGRWRHWTQDMPLKAGVDYYGTAQSICGHSNTRQRLVEAVFHRESYNWTVIQDLVGPFASFKWSRYFCFWQKI